MRRAPAASGMSGEGMGARIASRITPIKTPKPSIDFSVSMKFSMLKLKFIDFSARFGGLLNVFDVSKALCKLPHR